MFCLSSRTFGFFVGTVGGFLVLRVDLGRQRPVDGELENWPKATWSNNVTEGNGRPVFKGDLEFAMGWTGYKCACAYLLSITAKAPRRCSSATARGWPPKRIC